MMRILIVEDEQHLAEGLRFNLEEEGFEVQICESGEEALAAFSSGLEFSLLVLDVMLPGLSGFDVIQQLRAQGQYLPTLMLTARGRPEDVVRGIAAGADDYLAKPFELSVLLARIKSLLRRQTWMSAGEPAPAANVPVQEVEINGHRINLDSLEVHHAGQATTLTLMEANLLRYFLEREGQIVSRAELLAKVWQVHEDTDTRAIDNFIVRLRRHLETDPAHPQFLQTVRGGGFRLRHHPRAPPKPS
jgi:DNA-binding response OmpR family regulator